MVESILKVRKEEMMIHGDIGAMEVHASGPIAEESVVAEDSRNNFGTP